MEFRLNLFLYQTKITEAVCLLSSNSCPELAEATLRLNFTENLHIFAIVSLCRYTL